MRQRAWILLTFGYALAAAGLFVPFWPLALFGTIIAALSNRWFLALILGIMLDLIFGAPVGALHFLQVPFTGVAIIVALLEFYSAKYLISEGSDRL